MRLTVFGLAGVGVGQGAADIRHQAHGDRGGNALASCIDRAAQAGQIAPVQVLHGDVPSVAHPAELVDLHDVGMVEVDSDPRLVHEGLHEPRIVSVFLADPLDD